MGNSIKVMFDVISLGGQFMEEGGAGSFLFVFLSLNMNPPYGTKSPVSVQRAEILILFAYTPERARFSNRPSPIVISKLTPPVLTLVKTENFSTTLSEIEGPPLL